MESVEARVMQHTLEKHGRDIAGAHEKLSNHGVEITKLVATVETHHHRLMTVEQRSADAERSVNDLYALASAHANELRDISASQSSMLRLLQQHAAEESLELARQTKRIESLARHLVAIWVISVTLAFTAAKMIPGFDILGNLGF